MSWTMPAETAPHERVWMAFPRTNTTLAESAADAETAYAAWSEVANTVAQFEQVVMVVDPTETTRARAMLSEEIEIVEAPLDDAWMRDIGPTFVIDDAGQLGAVTWTFNGWGAQEWAEWTNDRQIGRVVAGRAGVPVVSSMLVQEGGAIHVDGEGTVLVTETVQLDPYRNPYATRETIEAELERTIGARKVIWLPRGLTRDYERFGTRGHVDMVATIPSPGRCCCTTSRIPTIPTTQSPKACASSSKAPPTQPDDRGTSSICPLPTRFGTPRASSTTATSTTSSSMVVSSPVVTVNRRPTRARPRSWRRSTPAGAW